MLKEASEKDLEAFDDDDEVATAPPPEPPTKTRNIVLCALSVMVLVFVAAKGSAVLHHKHLPPAASPLASTASAYVAPKIPRSSPPNRRKKLTEKQLEAQRLNDIKSKEIRESQDDPTSMFDMSNAR